MDTQYETGDIKKCIKNKRFLDYLTENPNKYRNYKEKKFEIGDYVYVLEKIPKLEYEFIRSNFFASNVSSKTPSFYNVDYLLPNTEIYRFKEFGSYHIKINSRGVFLISQNPINILPF